MALHPAAALLLVKVGVEAAGAVVGQGLGVAGLGRAEVGAAEGDVALSSQLVQQELLSSRGGGRGGGA